MTKPRLAYDGKERVCYVPDPEVEKAAKRRRELWQMAKSSVVVGACLTWVAVSFCLSVVLGVGTFVHYIPTYGPIGLLVLAIPVILISTVVLLFKIADKHGMI